MFNHFQNKFNVTRSVRVEKITRNFSAVAIAVAILMSILLLPLQAKAEWAIKSPDGSSSIKFGILGQFQGETLTTADGNHTSKDMYLRRFRIVFGGQLMENLTFFADTEQPNLGKVGNSATGDKTGIKDSVFMSDAFATYSFSNEFKIDAGMMLLPLSHHAEQSAASLLGIDYGPYTFVYSDPTGSRLGRDYGFEARGYLANNHFEYRVGMFQGVRGVNSTNPERITARVVYYPFQAETGYFYNGTYFGEKKILAIGLSADKQSDYKSYGADVFLDYPLANKDTITAQVDYTHFDGGDFITTLPKQNVIFGEAAYYFEKVKLAPFVQVNYENFYTETATIHDLHFMQAGLAYYVKGQTLNVKLGVGRKGGHNLENQTQVLLRAQVFVF
jgi:hypothetical protein